MRLRISEAPKSIGWGADVRPKSEAIPVVRLVEIHQRPDRDDPGRIDVVVREVIVTLDVIEVHGLGDAANLIEVAQITVKIRIIHDPAKITLKVTVVDRIETDERYEESPIGFDWTLSKEIAAIRQALLHGVDRRKDFVGGAFVGLLRRCKTRAVDAVVEGYVEEIVELVDLGAQFGRIEIDLRIGSEGIELAFQHAHDIVVGVADDAPSLLIPQHRNGDASGVGRIARRVGIAQELPAIDGIGLCRREAPAALVANRVHDRHTDRIFQAFEFAYDDRAARPRAGQRHV